MELTDYIASNRAVAETVCQRLAHEIDKLGLSATVTYPQYEGSSFELIKDPYTGQQNLCCYWFDQHKRHRLGRLQFNSDGSFYAEYDVSQPHPTKKKCFIESVTAWGQADNMKAEAKLLPMAQ